MKNQYFGDVGDFGKYGLLKALKDSDLKIGVNWYLTNDDEKTDGKHINYLDKLEFRRCDSSLCSYLYNSILENRRSVKEIYNYKEFESFIFYDEVLDLEHINALSERGRLERQRLRNEWFLNSTRMLKKTDIVFCDPDNGIETKSLSKFGKDSVKYTFVEELNQFLEQGKSVIVYNHRDRSPENEYGKRFKEIHSNMETESKLRILRFNRYSVRDYLFFIQPRHEDLLNSKLDAFLNDKNWNEHFKEFKIGE